jgi:L,D-transpeptidase catalytic domain
MDLKFDGQRVTWELPHRVLQFKASSGMSGTPDGKYDHRYPEFQDKSGEEDGPDGAGPVPEGRYKVVLNVGEWADPLPNCSFKPSWRLERIPRGAGGVCERYRANWGWNRIRFEATAATNKTMLKKYPKMKQPRSGFYLHDSRKGYSHGCIEVESRFFDELRAYLKMPHHKNVLWLTVAYPPGRQTYGGSDKLDYPPPPDLHPPARP